MLSEANFFAVMDHHLSVGRAYLEAAHDPDMLVGHLTVLPMFHLGAFGCLFTWAWMAGPRTWAACGPSIRT